MLASSTLAVGMIFTSSWAESIALHEITRLNYGSKLRVLLTGTHRREARTLP